MGVINIWIATVLAESVGSEGKSSDYTLKGSNIYALIEKDKLTKTMENERDQENVFLWKQREQRAFIFFVQLAV